MTMLHVLVRTWPSATCLAGPTFANGFMCFLMASHALDAIAEGHTLSCHCPITQLITEWACILSTALDVEQGDCGRVMVVLLTDGRANVSLAKSNDDPDAIGPDAVKPTTVRLSPAPINPFLQISSCVAADWLRCLGK